MSFAFLGLAVLVAVHLLVASALSLAVGTAFPPLQARLGRLDPGRRASLLLALGLLPAAGGLAAALGLALPAWLRHEPRRGGEEPGLVLVALAAAGAALVLVRLGAALRDHWGTARLVARWAAEGRELRGLALPATRLARELPLAALAGVLRPRLLLSEVLLRNLTGEELEAVVEHERAHVAARENLKRLLLRASPDPLAYFPVGASLRAAFEQAAEAAADRVACARVSPLVLARALLKVTALVPPGRRLNLALASLHREGMIAGRVRALLLIREQPAGAARSDRPGLAVSPFWALVLVPLAVVAAAASLPLVHRILEGLVHLLS